MVGREAERRQLEGTIGALKSGRGGFVAVSGDAGSGKTRLVAEVRHTTGQQVLWLEGQSSSYDQRVAYWPFVEILAAWLNLSEDGGEEPSWSLLVGRLRQLFDDEADEVIPYVAVLMGMQVRDPHSLRVKFLDPELLSRQVLWAVRRLFQRLAERQPVILMFDDFHWADDSSVGLVEHLLGLCAETQILLCVASRPDDGQVNRVLRAARQIDGLDTCEIALSP
jgi:predicted ATPase